MKFSGFLGATFAAATAAAAAAWADEPPNAPAARLLPKEASWAVRLPKEDRVTYHGLANFDSVGAGSRPMTYGPGLAIGITMLLVQKGVVDSQLDSQRRQVLDRADRVLLPYRTAIDQFTYRQLVVRALGKVMVSGNRRLVGLEENADRDWVVDSSAVFLMTQDQRALILEAALVIRSPEASAPPLYENAVKVLSRPRDDDDLQTIWSANDGEELKEESARLFGHALEIALRDASGEFAGTAAPHKTYRYREGEKERMERAQLVVELCDRIVARTLRGGLLSMPLQRRTGTDAVPAGCAGEPENK